MSLRLLRSHVLLLNSNALSWILYVVSQHPEVEEELRKEAVSLVGQQCKYFVH